MARNKSGLTLRKDPPLPAAKPPPLPRQSRQPSAAAVIDLTQEDEIRDAEPSSITPTLMATSNHTGDRDDRSWFSSSPDNDNGREMLNRLRKVRNRCNKGSSDESDTDEKGSVHGDERIEPSEACSPRSSHRGQASPPLSHQLDGATADMSVDAFNAPAGHATHSQLAPSRASAGEDKGFGVPDFDSDSDSECSSERKDSHGGLSLSLSEQKPLFPGSVRVGPAVVVEPVDMATPAAAPIEQDTVPNTGSPSEIIFHSPPPTVTRRRGAQSRRTEAPSTGSFADRYEKGDDSIDNDMYMLDANFMGLGLDSPHNTPRRSPSIVSSAPQATIYEGNDGNEALHKLPSPGVGSPRKVSPKGEDSFMDSDNSPAPRPLTNKLRRLRRVRDAVSPGDSAGESDDSSPQLRAIVPTAANGTSRGRAVVISSSDSEDSVDTRALTKKAANLRITRLDEYEAESSDAEFEEGGSSGNRGSDKKVRCPFIDEEATEEDSFLVSDHDSDSAASESLDSSEEGGDEGGRFAKVGALVQQVQTVCRIPCPTSVSEAGDGPGDLAIADENSPRWECLSNGHKY